ncbi:MAG: hypothetical protein ABI867_24590 [Kofleriaceae bacterium]
MKAVVLLALVACTPTRRFEVTGYEVHSHIRELRGLGHARVEIEVHHGDDPIKHRHEVIQLQQQVHVDGSARTIAELLPHCPDLAPPKWEAIPDLNQCELITRRNDPFLLRTQSGHFAPRRLGTIALGTGFLVGLVGGGVCAFECESGRTKGIAVATAVVSALGLLAMCAASNGCHD